MRVITLPAFRCIDGARPGVIKKIVPDNEVDVNNNGDDSSTLKRLLLAQTIAAVLTFVLLQMVSNFGFSVQGWIRDFS